MGVWVEVAGRKILVPLGRGMRRCCCWLTSPGALTIMVELAGRKSLMGDGVPDALTVMSGERSWWCWCGVRDRPRGRVEPWGFLELVGVNVRGSSWPPDPDICLKYWHIKDVCKDQDRLYHSFEYQLLPITIIIIQFCDTFVKVGVEGGFRESILPTDQTL